MPRRGPQSSFMFLWFPLTDAFIKSLSHFANIMTRDISARVHAKCYLSSREEGYCWNTRKRDEVRAGNNGNERMRDAGEPSGETEMRSSLSGAKIQSCACKHCAAF